MKLFADRGWNPRHDLGQNFLIDMNLLEYIVREADLCDRDVVLEVGAGTGGLTSFLAQSAAAVIAVEYDRQVATLAAEAIADLPQVTLLVTDVLANKSTLAPVVLEAVARALAVDPARRLKLVANLPYHVAGPIIANLMATEFPWEQMLVTVQWEAAQRFAAAPATGDYSALSVWIQAHGQIQILKKLPPQVFWPRPKIDSAIVRILPNPASRAQIDDRAFLQNFLRQIFTQRRKTLRTSLGKLFGDLITKPEVDRFLSAHQLSESVRAEELSVPLLIQLANRVGQPQSESSVQ